MTSATITPRLRFSDVTQTGNNEKGRVMTQAIVVGFSAFGAMVAAAAGVLWYTARERHHQHDQ